MQTWWACRSAVAIKDSGALVPAFNKAIVTVERVVQGDLPKISSRDKGKLRDTDYLVE